MNNRLLTEEEIIIEVCGTCPFQGQFTDEQCRSCQKNMELARTAQDAKTKREILREIREKGEQLGSKYWMAGTVLVIPIEVIERLEKEWNVRCAIRNLNQ